MEAIDYDALPSMPPSTPSCSPQPELTDEEGAALAAIQAYERKLKGKLIGDALEESATAVTTSFKKVLTVHTSEVGELSAENAQLRDQLLQATEAIERLSQQVIASDAQRAAAAASTADSGMGVDSTMAEMGSEGEGALGDRTIIKAGPSTTPTDADSEIPSSMMATIPGVSSTRPTAANSVAETIRSTMGTAGSVPLMKPDVLAALLADYERLKGTTQALEVERASWRRNLSELSRLLSDIVRENAQYRHECCLLKASTVPLTQYQDAVQQRDNALYQLEAMRLETAKLAEQLDMELQQRAEEAHTSECQALSSAVAALSSTAAHQQPGKADASGDQMQMHPGTWGLAVRELEEQAILAAGYQSTKQRLEEAEARIASLTSEKASLQVALDTLQKEDEALRSDAQSLVFRNGVLSQQIASLLVKVERGRRGADDGNGSAGGYSLASYAAEDPATPVYSESAALTRPQRRTESVKRRDGVTAAAAAGQILQRRSSIRALTTTSGAAPPSVSGSMFSNNASVPAPRGVSASSLDITFLPPSARPSGQHTLAPVEVEHGVSRSLGTYSSRRRRVTLRNMGISDLEVELPCEPRLPASDQLSGVALGRPSCYSVLDPTNGTVVRSSLPTAAPRNEALVSSSSSATGTSAMHSVDSDRSDLLAMLDMIDCDENLDRYSVNTVAELVVRNQELLKQLYDATQKSSNNNTNNNTTASGRPSTKNLTQQQLDNEEAAQPSAHHLPQASRKRTREEDHLNLSQPASRSEAETPVMGALHSGSNNDGVVVMGPSTVCSLSQQLTQQQQQDGDGAPIIGGLPIVGAWTEQVQDTATGLVEAVIRRHEAHVSRLDEGLSAALLPIIETQHRIGADDVAAEDSRRSAEHALVTALVELCATQAVTLAQHAADVGTTMDVSVEAHKKYWDGAQHLLKETVSDILQALSASRRSVQDAGTGAVGASLVGTTTTTAHSNVTNALESIAQLLQMATKKEGTLQRVYQAAQGRQEELLAKKEKQLARREARVARRRAAIEVFLSQQGRRSVAASPPLAPQPGASPTRGTPQLPPLSIGKSAKHQSAMHFDQSSDEDLGSDVEAEEQQVFTQLRDQLALEQAKQAALMKELDEEKRKHMSLYERMWQMELDRDAAVADRDAMSETISSMKTREEYESIVAILDSEREMVEDLNAQLRYAHQEKNRLQTEVDVQRNHLASHQQRHEEATLLIRESLNDAQRQLAETEEARAGLEGRCTRYEEDLGHMQQAAEGAAMDLSQRSNRIQQLEEQFAALQRDLLSQDNTQSILRRLYPGDSVLEAHTKLVTTLRREKEKLEVRVHHEDLQRHALQKELEAKENAVRAAVQERQAAEVRLQEALIALANNKSGSSLHAAAQLQEGGGGSNTATAAVAAGGCEEEGSPAVPRSLREMEAMAEAQRRELEALRSEEQSWKQREAEMRVMLEAMGRDPISEAVRRYGLQACRDFDGQLAEMQSRIDALTADAEALRSEKAQLELAVQDLKSTCQLAEASVSRLEGLVLETQMSREQCEAELTAAKEEAQQFSTSITEKTQAMEENEKQMQALNATLTELRDVHTALETKLAACEGDREQFLTDNLALVGKVNELKQNLTQSETEKRAANAALAQGMSASGRRHRLGSARGGGMSGSSHISLTDSLLQTPSPHHQHQQ